jgi:hypothetical protein
MRRINISILILVSSYTYGQPATNTEARDSTNLYYQALKVYVNAMTTRNREKPILFVEKNPVVTNSLPSQLGVYEFKYLEGYEVDQKLKGENPITLIRIVPVRMKNGIFYINIIPFTVKRENRKINYINSGGDRISFEFDCSTNSFRFKEIAHGNI